MRCAHEGLKGLLSGAGLGGLSLSIRGGRFREEHNVELYVADKRACSLKVFCGRGPYRAWVEVFDVNPSVFPSVEAAIYDAVAASLMGGESIFVEYGWDPESVVPAELGLPPHLTRIGEMLVERGFTWLKLWYFPEGHMEGGQKIQAQKPVNEAQRRRNAEEACRELASIGSIRGVLDERRRRLMSLLSCAERGLG